MLRGILETIITWMIAANFAMAVIETLNGVPG
jgi:hypothetical protein